MSDLSWRIIILVLVAAAVVLAVWRFDRAKRVRPVQVTRADLGAGVHFFSAATCATCLDARQVLQAVYGNDFSEVRFEDDPTGFGAYGVASVPTVFILGADGQGVRFEGVPSRRQLQTLGSEPP
ncbi:MAG TPA: hypothetical protein VIB78_06280 [Acidimicrobiia bacterium]|jgi:hypothetical protein